MNDIGTNNFGMNAMDLWIYSMQQPIGVLKNSLCNNSNSELCSNTFIAFKKKNAFIIEHTIRKLFMDWAINNEVFLSRIQRLA